MKSAQSCREQFQTPYFWVFVCMHSNSINSTTTTTTINLAEGAWQNITYFMLSLYAFSSPKQSIFTWCANFVSNWSQVFFVCEVSRQKKWGLLSQEGKETLSSRFFKVPWQQNIQKNVDENSRQREADYKGDNLLLQLQDQQSLISHTQALCHILYLVHCAKTLFFSVLSWSFIQRMSESCCNILAGRRRAQSRLLLQASLAPKALA